jgi:hypothetical protein
VGGTRGVDDRLEPIAVEFTELVERARSAVAAQVDVRVDEPRQHRGAGKVHDRATFGRGRFHTHDPAVRHEHD